jgi:hypothetical protein
VLGSEEPDVEEPVVVVEDEDEDELELEVTNVLDDDEVALDDEEEEETGVDDDDEGADVPVDDPSVTNARAPAMTTITTTTTAITARETAFGFPRILHSPSQCYLKLDEKVSDGRGEERKTVRAFVKSPDARCPRSRT